VVGSTLDVARAKAIDHVGKHLLELRR
jgi:hypothetical protein